MTESRKDESLLKVKKKNLFKTVSVYKKNNIKDALLHHCIKFHNLSECGIHLDTEELSSCL